MAENITVSFYEKVTEIQDEKCGNCFRYLQRGKHLCFVCSLCFSGGNICNACMELQVQKIQGCAQSGSRAFYIIVDGEKIVCLTQQEIDTMLEHDDIRARRGVYVLNKKTEN